MVKHAERRVNHGLSHTTLWEVWNAMLQRCCNPSCKVWKWYGGKGIRVCRAWRDFLTFRSWALRSGYRDGLTIDRKSSKQNYTPKNCRWVTKEENSRNLPRVRWLVAAFGEKKTIGQWLRDPRCQGQKESRIRMRLSRGWSAEAALTSPNRKQG